MNEQSPAEALPEIIQDWADIAFAVLTKRGRLAEDAARTLANEIAVEITGEYGGRTFYLAKCAMLRLDRRDRMILDEFNGHNHALLAKKHSVSERHIRRLIGRMEALETRKRQVPLFPSEPPPAAPNRR